MAASLSLARGECTLFFCLRIAIHLLLILPYPFYLLLFSPLRKKRVYKPSTVASREIAKIKAQKSREAKRGDKERSGAGHLRFDHEAAMLAIKDWSADADLFPIAGVPLPPFLVGLISDDIENVGRSLGPLGNFGLHPHVTHFFSTGRKTNKNAVKVVAVFFHFEVDEASKPPKTSVTRHVLFVADSHVTTAEVLFRSMPMTTDSGEKPVTKEQMRQRVLMACSDTNTGLSSVFNEDRLFFMTLKQFEAKEAEKAAAEAAAAAEAK